MFGSSAAVTATILSASAKTAFLQFEHYSIETVDHGYDIGFQRCSI
jgi:hypothetical protein